MNLPPTDRRIRTRVIPVLLGCLLLNSGCDTLEERNNPNRAWLVATNREPARSAPPRLTSGIAPRASLRIYSDVTGPGRAKAFLL